MNIPKLPNDVLIKILSINEENNFKQHKLKFNNVLYELECIEDEIHYYFDMDSIEDDDENIGISYYILGYLEQINLFSDEDY
tara:strand:+ start:591 stop:836 length:246 start_codon:yes stop_codon:yes gene_type:complete